MLCQLKRINKVYLWLKNQRTCLLCLDHLNAEIALCTDCLAELPWLLHACTYCALPVAPHTSLCRQCERQRQPFTQVISPMAYRFPVNSLISRFKYNSQWPLGHALSQLLAQHIAWLAQEQITSLPDCLIAVPLARKRQRQRGYNQAQMIANWLGHALQRPVLSTAVQRVRYTAIQQGLNAEQRQRNMRNAFVLRQPEQIAGCHIGLVDDVLTTGATCAALSQVLLDAGARRVDVYALARTGLSVDEPADPFS